MGEAPSGRRRADAVVIAGGVIRNEELRRVVGVDCRALIDLLGKPMAQRTVEALRASRAIGRVVVVGRPALRETAVAAVADAIIEEGADEVDNLYLGVAALPGAEWVYMASGDVPLLTPDAVNDLIENAPRDADVVFPICERADAVRDFPGRNWTLVKTPDGAFTGASGFLFRPAAIADRRAWVQQVFDSRRSVWKLMHMWGLGFALRALLHRVSLAEVEAHCSRVLGLRAQAYVSRFTELCFDVDYAPDVALARERLRARETP
jgi:molybdopterin-guanine dinucleotide biosynthesis protein A